MSIRGIWVFSIPGKTDGKLLFSRVFPTVEKRCKLLDTERYVPLPSSAVLKDAVYHQLGYSSKEIKFSIDRDACDSTDQNPVFQIPTSSGPLWPFLVVEQHGLLFCCLPLVEQGTQVKPALHHIPGLSSGFNLILGMIDFLGQLPKPVDETHSKLADLALFIGEAAPLGTPLDTRPHTVRAALQGRAPSAVQRQQQQAAWHPIQHKGRGQIHFTIKEYIRAALYDNNSVPDVWDAYGTISCRAELEGNLPEVTMTLSPRNPATSIPMDHILTHPCVQSLNPQVQQQVEDGSMNGCSLRFTPSPEAFTLCHYTMNTIKEPLIHGFYQMKGEKNVEVLVQLKLSETVKNSFEYCEVQLPFHHRGPIVSQESSASHGSVLLSPDKTVLVWNIGQRFPTRTLEVLLKATIHFSRYDPPQPEQGTPEQMFCVGQNCFAQLFFKLSNSTLSGMTIDPKSIHVTPNTKYKLLIDMDLTSGDYRVWNSHGEVPAAYTPSPFLVSEMQTFPHR